MLCSLQPCHPNNPGHCIPWKVCYTSADDYEILFLHCKEAAAAAASNEEETCMDNEMADKLDILMEILFNNVHEITHINGKLN